MYRVLKSKYFPNDAFMESGLAYEAREVLQLGVRWRVGNGVSITIWKDKWLPFQSSFLPMPRLIDGETKQWK